ncbi:MAG TPA: hypothetical protein VIC53_01750 [Wenzhouxiangella sp.]
MSERILLAGFLILSVLGHLVVFALIGLQKPKTLPAPQPVVQVALVERPEPVSEPKPDVETPPASESLPQPPEPESTQAPLDQPPTTTTQEPPEEIVPSIASSEAEVEPEPVTGARLITNLNTQLPRVVAKLNPMAAPEQKISHLGKAAPKLPGGPSLFDEWMGPVKPNLDRWRDASGGVNAQVTLANGDLVCIKVRAPTTQELLNPWMSAAVPMSRVCGRRRPEPVDTENPWLRARPK